MPADPAEGQQVVDERLHPLGAVHGELDVLVSPGVELADVPALQQLAEARDLAQRLLQVVRGYVGELLKLGVRPLQVEGTSFEPDIRCPDGRQLAQDPLAHPVDVDGQLVHLPRTARVDLVIEVAVGDLSRVAGQPRQWPDGGSAQARPSAITTTSSTHDRMAMPTTSRCAELCSLATACVRCLDNSP